MEITKGPSGDDYAYFTIELIADAKADAKSKAEKDADDRRNRLPVGRPLIVVSEFRVHHSTPK